MASIHPDIVELSNLAILTYREGRTADALSLFEHALGLAPHNINILGAYCQVLRENGRTVEALNHFLRAMVADPRNAVLANAVGVCFQESGNRAKAAEYYLRAMTIAPSSAEAHNNLGVLLLDEKNSREAIPLLQQAIALDPTYSAAYNNLAISHRDQLEYYESIAAFRRALELKPGDAGITAGLGEVLGLIYDETAESYLRRAVEIEPGNPEHHWNLAIEILKRGKYLDGWNEYEWRWKRVSSQETRRPFEQPSWSNQPGQEIRGQNILLHAEQGFGDTFQMLRYVPQVLDLGAHVILEVPQPLKSIVSLYVESTNEDSRIQDIRVIAAGEPLPSFDWHVPMMSLPHAFGSTLDTLPPPLRLTPAAERPQNETLRIGLCWAGNSIHVRDRERSLPLELLRPLFSIPHCTFVSLQVGPEAQQIAACQLPLEQPVLPDFVATANLLDTLDLVITVDTAVAHLAASQGVPTWLVLHHVADWRWLRPPGFPGAREPNPWYPEARIFRSSTLPRQPGPEGAWGPTIAAVAEHLRALSVSKQS